jgi:EAL domain-containing protein (putative c-di-GMP-specific phosphodiesterase class I)
VAEGAETDEEVVWLRSAGCDLVQGFRVAKPMPVSDFTAWVREFNQRAFLLR